MGMGGYKDLGKWVLKRSIILAIRQQGWSSFYRKLEGLVPDISEQYNDLFVDTPYLKTNVRGMHCFQMDLVDGAVREGESLKDLRVVDIGDSCGNHIAYLKGLFPLRTIDALSVNPDHRACEKIMNRGGQALCCYAENFQGYGFYDLAFIFEVLEHISDPIGVLRKLSGMDIDRLIITVPFVRRTRVHLKGWKDKGIEDVHIFELNPADWKRLFDYCGWQVVKDQIYYQYPRWMPFSWLLKLLWKWKDYEGFYGVVLKKGVKGLKPDKIVIDELKEKINVCDIRNS